MVARILSHLPWTAVVFYRTVFGAFSKFTESVQSDPFKKFLPHK